MAEREIDFSQIKKKRGRRRRYMRLFSFLVLFSALFFASWWLVFRSPVFRVERVEVDGAAQISVDEVVRFLKQKFSSSARARFFGLENMLGWPNEIGKSDLKLLPAVRGITIEKRYGERTVWILVEEREPVGIWCVKKDAGSIPNGKLESPVRCAWFDGEGVAFKESIEAEGSLLLTVSDYSSDALVLGSKILPEKLVPNLLSVLKVLAYSDVRVAEIRVNDLGTQEIEVRTYDGPALYFSLRFLADAALPIIEKLFPSQGGKKLEYMDFRVENRAYYR